MSAPLLIAPADPQSYADDLKALFLAHDRPEFPAFYDRAYPGLVRDGARCWRASDADGRLVMHIARFPHRFAHGDTVLNAGLLGNLMCAADHRSFFPALNFFRRVVRDSREEGGVDLLFGDPVPAAEGLFKAAGYQKVGTVDRFTLPIGDLRFPVDLAVRTWRRVQALRWRARGRAVAHPAPSFDASDFMAPAAVEGVVRGFRSPALLAARLDGCPSADDSWLTWHRAPGTAPDAAMLVRRTPHPGFFTLCSLWRRPGLALRDVMPAFERELRRLGCRRLQLWTLLESRLAREAEATGFVLRPEPMPLYALALTDRGRDALSASTDWEITHLDCDR